MNPEPAAMIEEDLHETVRRLEDAIETAGETLERCRKLIFAGKISAAAGAIWLLAVVLGPLAGAGSLAGATAALLGGIVVFGSNTMTARETEGRIAAAEAARSELIDRLAPRTVSN